MTERVLQGPFLTRAQAGRRAGIPARILVHRPDLLQVSSRWLQEAYFGFQFDAHGVRPDVGSVVQHLRGRSSDVDIGDWLVRPNRSLAGATPLEILDGRAAGAVDLVVRASERDGPVAEDLWTELLRSHGTSPASPPEAAPPPLPAPSPDGQRVRSRPRMRRPSRSSASVA